MGEGLQSLFDAEEAFGDMLEGIVAVGSGCRFRNLVILRDGFCF